MGNRALPEDYSLYIYWVISRLGQFQTVTIFEWDSITKWQIQIAQLQFNGRSCTTNLLPPKFRLFVIKEVMDNVLESLAGPIII